jgi:hypothetical protein
VRHDIQHNDIQHNNTQHTDNQHKRLFCNTQHSSFLCTYTERRFAKCGVFNVMLSVVMLNVIMPSIVAPSDESTQLTSLSLLS